MKSLVSAADHASTLQSYLQDGYYVYGQPPPFDFRGIAARNRASTDPVPHPNPWIIFNTQETPSAQNVIMQYKTRACVEWQERGTCRQGSLCLDYHSARERRRPPFQYGQLAYVDTFCPAVSQGLACPHGDQCMYVHTPTEASYHPANYKTLSCMGPCFQDLCPGVHSHEETRSPALLEVYQAFPHLPSAYGSVVYTPAPPLPPASVPAFDAELVTFKTLPCSLQYQHNHKHCPYFHSPKDRRRQPGRYSFDLCEDNEKNSCSLGETCTRAHSMVERLYHPDKYKTKYCNYYPGRLHECEYGTSCCFAHCDAELKVELLHYLEQDWDFYMFYFKTAWCPFNREHNKAMCVYAHNWQDYRRKPHLFGYSSDVCPNWQSEIFISEYKEGCPSEQHCSYSHGWKEQLFHPHTYKTCPCPEMKTCHRGCECPYYHDDIDRRCPNRLVPYTPRARELQPSVVNPNSINLNALKEIELKQQYMSADTGPAYAGIRRYSAEPPYGPTLTEQTTPRSADGQIQVQTQAQAHVPAHVQTQTLHREARVSKLVTEKCPLNHIREESPELKESSLETAQLFAIFNPLEETKTTSSILFSPVCTTEGGGKRFTWFDPQQSSLGTVLQSAAGHRSCPATPILKRQSFGKPSVFQSLHLDEDEPTGKDTTRIEEEMLKVSELLESLGLKSLYPLFAKRELTTNDILLMTPDEYKDIGVLQDADIEKIMQRVRENLESHFNDSLKVARIPLIALIRRTG